MLTNKKITLYVSGSIAVYKSLSLLRLLIKKGNQVTVVMTKAATEFVTPLTFMTLSKQTVYTDEFKVESASDVNHIKIADETDLAIVAPATADLIAKMANGIADDIASSALLATTAPIYVVPTMNTHMLENPATKRNIRTLREDGIQLMDSATGFLAEGYEGKGRMPEPVDIVSWLEVMELSVTKQLQGKKIIVTAGGTKERIDPVRYLSNDSSGKMGYAIARVAQRAGAEVILMTGKTSLSRPTGMKIIDIESAAELFNAVKDAFTDADGLIMAAAVADFRPLTTAKQKIKKNDDNDLMNISLTKNPDIVAEIGKIKRSNQFVVGFAAETNDLLENATKKMLKKHLDLIVANDVANINIGFNSDDNQVTFIFKNGQQIQTPIESKLAIATELINVIGEQII
ncbi:bifunctional phosphopantothenoylcysteine decarboxylase/phosphopantothenate--cysteine ligase CoaBC [Lentilactobacillus kribbianus]|uniref:bifunctional phosphopantothenoylcysteine decarboxylase/phosphopantothenate--cysteine ligase CoaBC n=1 Tax=Lentilactobacillus kribbianus TaxID=2729622 RepID=UPI001557606B|nr:bifunctional phosphopantothenoylcysteine decarboxylase/phosphopantothenate--cysteine ligase CoaBC [Lentilactobacillus kribbianus]